MKIAIDVSSIIYGTGVSVYTKNLVENLLKVDKENHYILFGGSLRRFHELKNEISRLTSKRKNFVSKKIFSIPPTLADLFWNKFHIIPIERLIGKVDVFHSSDWTQPPSSAFNVTTIHDLVPIKFPELSDSKIVSAHKARIKWILKEVDRVIVPSQATAYDVEKLKIKRQKIRIIPEAPDPSFRKVPDSEVKRIKKRYKIKGNYLLVVGVSPRKNTQRIINAFEKISKETKLKLVIVGYKYSDFTKTKDVIFLGHIPQIDLPILYSGARALVYPSLYEGFGLPILEAFACKTPVVTSNLGSMKEVAQDAAVLVNPFDENSIAEGILEAIEDRGDLVKRGSKRLRLYSWKVTALKTLEVYSEALNKTRIF